MLPIGDDNIKSAGIAFVTMLLIAVNVMVFLFQASLPSDAALQSFVTAWGGCHASTRRRRTCRR